MRDPILNPTEYIRQGLKRYDLDLLVQTCGCVDFQVGSPIRCQAHCLGNHLRRFYSKPENRVRIGEATRNFLAKNPEREALRIAKITATHRRPEVRAKNRVAVIDYLNKHPEMRKVHGDRIKQSQRCGVLDHDHVTGLVRDLVCQPCNANQFGDALIEKKAEYLRWHRENPGTVLYDNCNRREVRRQLRIAQNNRCAICSRILETP